MVCEALLMVALPFSLPVMKSFQIDLPAIPSSIPIRHTDRVMLIGSCFTEHISKRMENVKMNILSNPHGILFNPISVAKSLERYLIEKQYDDKDLFLLNEIWNCWDFHSRFSDIDKAIALKKMNESVNTAGHFIQNTDWLIITLGSAYQYFYTQNQQDFPVANCHRAPAQWFAKRMLSMSTIIEELKRALALLFTINPSIQIIFTISPVRHLRDGAVNNNRSKARLIEAIHHLTEELKGCSYFPAYELIIDVLRDYRFYDIDMAHPNYAATQFVWEHFEQTFFEDADRKLIAQLQELNTAYNHRSRFPETAAHQQFLNAYFKKILQLEKTYPYLNLKKEKEYFSAG